MSRLIALVIVAAALPARAVDRAIVVLPLDVTKTAGKMGPEARASLEEELRDEAATALADSGWTVMTGETTLRILTDSGIDPAKCGEGSCHLDTAKQMNVGKFISGAVQYSEGGYTASIRLIDTMTGNILASARLESKTVRGLRKDFAAGARAFFQRSGLLRGADAAQTPGVGSGPKAMIPLPSWPPPVSSAVNLDVDADLMVAYDSALKADESKESADAIAAWKFVADFEGKNPYRAQAKERMAAWKAYSEQQSAAAARLQGDTERLRKILPLVTLKDEQKKTLLDQFEKAYGPEKTEPMVALLPDSPLRSQLCRSYVERKIGRSISTDIRVEEAEVIPVQIMMEGVAFDAATSVVVPDCVRRVTLINPSLGQPVTIQMTGEGKSINHQYPRYAVQGPNTVLDLAKHFRWELIETERTRVSQLLPICATRGQRLPTTREAAILFKKGERAGGAGFALKYGPIVILTSVHAKTSREDDGYRAWEEGDTRSTVVSEDRQQEYVVCVTDIR